ncbi:hypothetical protein E2C01_027212 [Portunus trituberculatus]|uniref:Uncharacterized protein n=1 Tax=Portunus trituberculatus TaxID=210409 RepID=A0A5B7EKY3_PORTR|nr:hypothetical protein [Portunus trituberculatus]
MGTYTGTLQTGLKKCYRSTGCTRGQDRRQGKDGLSGILTAVLVVTIEKTHCPHISCQYVEDVVGKTGGWSNLLQE